ncbi:hypothetical protein [Wenzhouxiangella marina]|uniref:Uncharacterized protein n=1 Tax=Wenzhouxiangella marina TaxID=1579979 RepID=A0A0K0XYA4_9GAMM|nr:hypothetical protein [Wenzhouxiangella marina]AKS42663.1 hypothetical protein WM2015_2300 [Wenzhouxiangella marina]MBB6088649.1 hypothetical protein [Wenzhouxiangella marina]
MRTVSIFLALIVLGCKPASDERALRSAFSQALENRDVDASIDSFERLASDYHVTGSDTVEAAWLMLHCKGDLESALDHLGRIQPETILQNTRYPNLEHQTPDALQRLNVHYYRSFHSLYAFATCLVEDYAECQTVTQNALASILGDAESEQDRMDGWVSVEVQDLRWLQSLNEEELRAQLSQQLHQSMEACSNQRAR